MIRNQNKRKLTLTTDTVRRLGELTPRELERAAGGYNTQTVCPTVMQTHCYSCRSICVD